MPTEYRVDYDQTNPVTIKEVSGGALRVSGTYAAPGILRYVGPDGSVRRELVTQDTLDNSTAHTTMDGAVVTFDHPPSMVNNVNVQEYNHGNVEASTFANSGAHAVFIVRTKAIIDAIRSDGYSFLSPGYEVDLDPTAGTHPEFGDYDAIQLGRTYNHLAVVQQPRGGSRMQIRMDGADVGTRQDDEKKTPKPLPEGAIEAYKNGIKRYEDGQGGDGLEPATVAKARAFVKGEKPSERWIAKAARFWSRNSRFADEEPGSPAYTSAQLWGGKAGETYYLSEAKRLGLIESSEDAMGAEKTDSEEMEKQDSPMPEEKTDSPEMEKKDSPEMEKKEDSPEEEKTDEGHESEEESEEKEDSPEEEREDRMGKMQASLDGIMEKLDAMQKHYDAMQKHYDAMHAEKKDMEGKTDRTDSEDVLGSTIQGIQARTGELLTAYGLSTEGTETERMERLVNHVQPENPYKRMDSLRSAVMMISTPQTSPARPVSAKVETTRRVIYGPDANHNK